ncbi:PilW family protein [Sporomusa aerivorans]|uniref:PilW family protein n=1 Tax=Sporomusa aerivorans TaxID=204936 RepID=UPI00352AE3B4
MKSILNRQSGVSLVELVIALMLIVLLLPASLGLLTTALSAWKAGISRSEVQQTARFALDSMVRNLRYGDTYMLESNKSITYRNVRPGNQQDYIYRYNVGADHKLYHSGVTPYSTPQPVTGDNIKGGSSIIINANGEPLFTQPNGTDTNYIIITIYAADTATGQTWETASAVVSLPRVLR